MKCYRCGAEIEKGVLCPKCGTDNTPYIMILRESNRLYNEGLSLAQIRDLSGATDRLVRSLRLNKYNTKARNLLGLVYFETGETVMAIDEWVISKNLSPDDNDSDRYLHSIEYGQGMVEQLDRINKKYNLALSYAKEGKLDLAEIQLRRVIGSNPKMIRSRQLLSLLYIQDGNFEGALKELNAAIKIDASNPVTIKYLREVREKVAEKNKDKKSNKKSETLYIQDGNDTVLMPRQSFISVLDSSKGGILNVIIGAVIGLLIAIFLIVPTVRQNENNTNANALVSANQDAKNSETNISTLQKQVDDLNAKLENYEGKGDIKTSYEKLIEAQNFVTAGDMDSAKASLSQVNRDLLEANGQSIFDTLSASVNAAENEKAYSDGVKALNSKDYASAITSLLSVVQTDETYAEYQAMYDLAYAYEKSGDNENAINYYNKVAENNKKKLGRRAKKRSETLASGGTNDDENTSNLTTDNGNADSQNSNASQNSNTSTTQPDTSTQTTDTTAPAATTPDTTQPADITTQDAGAVTQ